MWISRMDIIPVTPRHEHYRLLREALDNHRVATWGKIKVKIPTKEYWIRLKLASFRDKDKYHLTEMLKIHHLLGLTINILVLNRILRRFPQLEIRWMEILAKLKEEYKLMINNDGRIIRSEENNIIYLRRDQGSRIRSSEAH